jgi:hypothetical protein
VAGDGGVAGDGDGDVAVMRYSCLLLAAYVESGSLGSGNIRTHQRPAYDGLGPRRGICPDL